MAYQAVAKPEVLGYANFHSVKLPVAAFVHNEVTEGGSGRLALDLGITIGIRWKLSILESPHCTMTIRRSRISFNRRQKLKAHGFELCVLIVVTS